MPILTPCLKADFGCESETNWNISSTIYINSISIVGVKLSVVLDECQVKSCKMVAAILPNKRAVSAVGIEVSLYDVVWENVILTVSHSSDSCSVPIPGSVLCHLSMT